MPLNSLGGLLRTRAPIPAPQSYNPLGEQLPVAAPPATPEEQQSRLAGWNNLLQSFRTNPEMQALALKFGTTLLQPRAPGQNELGHIAASIQSSADYLAASRAARAEEVRKEREEGRQDRDIARQERGTAADIERSRAVTELDRAENKREETKLPHEIAAEQARIRASDASAAGAYSNVAADRARIGQIGIENEGLRQQQRARELEYGAAVDEKAMMDSLVANELALVEANPLYEDLPPQQKLAKAKLNARQRIKASEAGLGDITRADVASEAGGALIRDFLKPGAGAAPGASAAPGFTGSRLVIGPDGKTQLIRQ
jgi:hypothetical protein